jgi:Flp pilus assembly pilin Flp
LWRSERGQTLTEYVMIAGLLTAIIISITGIIVPGLSRAIVGLVRYVAVNVASGPV